MKWAIVTTCMGRLEHLKKSLPRFVEQVNVDASVYVVNWSSPDGLSTWLETLDATGLHEVRVLEQHYFHLAAARNRGGDRACADGADLLAFIDADILLPSTFLEGNQEIADNARAVFADQFFLQSKKLIVDGAEDFCIWGSCIVPATLWQRTQYNEAISTYGHEDNELYSLWSESGVRRLDMDVQGVSGITHSDMERMRFYREGVDQMRSIRDRNKALYRGRRTDLF